MKIKQAVTVPIFMISSYSFGMDVDTSPSGHQQNTAVSPHSTQEEDVLFFKINDGSIIEVPQELLWHFEDKIEVAREITDDMVLNLPMLSKKNIDDLFALLNVGDENKIRNAVYQLPEEEVLSLAKISTLLNTKVLKNIFQDFFARLNFTTSFSAPEVIPQILSQFDVLDSMYIDLAKKALFSDFKRYLRDKNPFFKSKIKVLTTVPAYESNYVCIAGNGSTCAWMDNQRTLYIKHLTTQKVNKFPQITAQNIHVQTLTFDYTGSMICFAGGNDVKILNIQTRIVHETPLQTPVVKIIPNDNGSLFLIETNNGFLLCKFNKDTDTLNSGIPLTLPSAPGAQELPYVLSACFSYNNDSVSVLYDDTVHELPLLCIYNTRSGELLFQHEVSFPYGCLASTYNNNRIWIGSNGKIAGYTFNIHTKAFSWLESSVKIEDFDFMRIIPNNANDFMLAYADNGTALININTSTIDCIYTSLNNAVFGPDQKSIIAISETTNPDNSRNVIQIPFRYPEFNADLDTIIEKLSLSQLYTLTQLEESFTKKLGTPSQPIFEFLNTVPASVRDFIREYIFDEIQAANDDIPTRPTKRQKTSHTSS